jgi:glycosyltransferase involved in cell wall biosynthesis
MKRVLMLASVASMIDQFNMSNISILLDMGYEVHVACNFEKGNTCSDKRIQELQEKLRQLNISYHQINFARNIIKINQNIKAYHQVLNLLTMYKYDFIHCHSPIGGLCGRIAAHLTKTKVIYTAHGFHFFKGAPIKNWLLYYPVERWLSRYTDVLITINKEDYNRAKRKFRTKQVEYMPGVGIDIEKINNVNIDKETKRKELNVASEAFVVLSVGELNKNKNHEVIIKALAEIKNPNIYYIICGQGKLESYLKELIGSFKLENQVKLLGFRNDIAEICKASDVFAFPSRREGLGLAALEAMASGLPIITSNMHGIVDYSINELTGFNCNPSDIDGFIRAIERMINDSEMRIKMGWYNIGAVKTYDLKDVKKTMGKIYNDING